MTPNIVALVPAHNEEASVGQTVLALRSQTVPPTRIIVISDNSTDRTVEVARQAGAEVMETVGNTAKKAGALNQALEKILPELRDNDYVLVQDADTVLSPEFLEVSTSRFSDPKIGAVGGSFFPIKEVNLVQTLQGNEYTRYVREISRRPGARANVLTGAGSIFRADVLKEVAAGRKSGALPGSGVYKQDALTEDNELTLAIKRLGYAVVSPKKAAIFTDTPDSWRELKHQRVRWRRGALEDLKSHGLNKTTAPYIGKMMWTILVSLLSVAYIGLLIVVVLSGQQLIPSAFWLSVLAIYLLDRWWTVRGRPARAQAIASLFIFEVVYDIFQQIVLAVALLGFAARTDQRWVH